MQVTASSDSETSKKGLYALAALLRNNAAARTQFYSNSGVRRLTEILTNPEQTQQVQLKILNLVTDLSQLDLSSQVSDYMHASLSHARLSGMYDVNSTGRHIHASRVDIIVSRTKL